MISKLVLVRHGKAQGGLGDTPDELRELTAAGKRAWSAHCARLLKPLLEEDTPHIWASSAVRARQTADILARALNVNEVQELPELYGGNAYAVADALNEATGCVVLVGHEPFMSDFCAQLNGGTYLRFATGATAAFALMPPDSQTEAPTFERMQFRFLWFVQGSESSRWKTLCQLEAGLSAASTRIQDAATRLLELPDDAEALHKYRISLRIARSLLAFSRPWLKGAYRRRLDADLRRLQEPTSRVREMDILLQALQPGGTAAMLAAHERYELRVAFIESLRKPRTQKMLRQARKDLCKPRWREYIEGHGLGYDEIARRLYALQDEQDTLLETLDYSNQEAVHDIRKKAKALRYAARENASCLPKGCKQLSAQMQAVQDQLGALCDAWVNEALMARLPCEEASSLAAIERARAEEIIAELEATRKLEADQDLRQQS